VYASEPVACEKNGLNCTEASPEFMGISEKKTIGLAEAEGAEARWIL
jgi:hypothetical protein